jgi:hypothetical protein
MALALLSLPVELLDRIADQFPEAEQDGRIRQHDAKSLWLVCRKTEMKTRIWSEGTSSSIALFIVCPRAFENFTLDCQP